MARMFVIFINYVYSVRLRRMVITLHRWVNRDREQVQKILAWNILILMWIFF